MRQGNEPAVFKSSVGVVLKGDKGDSAYDIAVQDGFVGTKQEWLQSLKGEAIKAEAFTQQAMQYSNAAQNYAVASGSSATEAKGYRDEAQAIKDSISPEADSALAEIRAAKSEAQMMATQVDLKARIAETNSLQTQADAAETRHLYTEVIRQKNAATDAASKAELYSEGYLTATRMYYNRNEIQELMNGWMDHVDEKDAVLAGRIDTLEAGMSSSSAVETERQRAEAAEAGLSSDISTLDTTLRQKIASDLQNYYTKSETYSKAEVDSRLIGIQTGSQEIDLTNYATKDKIVTMGATQPEYGLWLRPIS